MSSDISNASYALDNTGFVIKSALKDFTRNTLVTVSPFTDFTSNFSIFDYPYHNMIPLNKTAIPSYDCSVNDTKIVTHPLVQYESQLFCYKLGSSTEIKLIKFLLSIDGPPPSVITYSITNVSDLNL